MQTLQVTRTTENRTFVQTWTPARVGGGNTVHLAISGANAICGTGNNGRGTRGRSTPRPLKADIAAVTCKKCLASLAEAQADAAGYNIEIVSA